MCSHNSSNDFKAHFKCETDPLSVTCRKCGLQASVVLQSKFSYCNNCFIEYFKHKFRATVGKTKIMKHDDNILIGFSGSASSLCLIDLVRDSLNDGKKKKMSFNVNILFINENSIYNRNDHTLIDMDQIKDILAPYHFKIYHTDLGAFLIDEPNLEENNLYSEPHKLDWIKELFLKIQTLSSKTDMLHKIRNNILLKVASKMGCQKVFTAETSDHLAMKTIANIVLGRGGQLPQDIGFYDDRVENVIIIRPLQDCSKKEVTYYNVFRKLKPLTKTSFSNKGDKYSSIQRLSENFINDLQHSFPSTVNTVHATGNKISVNNANKTLGCCLCEGKVDEKKTELTAEEASQISILVSSHGASKCKDICLNPKNKINMSSSGECSGTEDYNNEVSIIELMDKSLCYGCKLIIRDTVSLGSLPTAFLAKIQENAQLNQMHDEIREFLF